jgi:hypothetical protein
MATAQITPKAVAGAGGGALHGSTRAELPGPRQHHPLRTALRGAGVFLDTTWRVVLLGGEGIDGVKRR